MNMQSFMDEFNASRILIEASIKRELTKSEYDKVFINFIRWKNGMKPIPNTAHCGFNFKERVIHSGLPVGSRRFGAQMENDYDNELRY